MCDNGDNQSLKFLCTIKDNKIIIQCWQHCLHTTTCPTKLTYKSDIYEIKQLNTIYVKVKNKSFCFFLQICGIIHIQ